MENELLKKIRKIEIKTKSLSHQIFAGEYHSAFKGRGMAFSEVREYQFGDDVRNMDWNVTARLRSPYIKIFEEEREMTVVLLVDVSSSGIFGTSVKTKRELAAEVAAVLSQNIVLSQYQGICPFLGVSKKISSAAGMGFAVIFVMAVSSVFTWLVYNYVLVPLGLDYLYTMAFILVIASLVQITEMVVKRYSPTLYSALGVYLPLITTNCAILGTANSAVVFSSYAFVETFAVSVATGVGFLLAIVLLACVRLKTDRADIPKCFKGFPITLVTAAIMALAFAGFAGILG